MKVLGKEDYEKSIFSCFFSLFGIVLSGCDVPTMKDKLDRNTPQIQEAAIVAHGVMVIIIITIISFCLI